ncbi:aTP-dependent DNA helicase PcrA [Prevotella sp. CAG:755]|nr:aTP-dependent DNA helicase PcrA [Prevotella sp. CAG:755]
MADLYARYERRCRQANAMDFDDLLLRTYQLLRDHPDTCHKYKERFQYVLVDEYQDTNFAQHRIVSLLTDPTSRICVVGDDAQSIYGFRGAEIGNILQFNTQYAGARLFKLECNYRSTRHIVEAANSVISHNKGQIPKAVYSNRDAGEKITVMAAMSDKEEGQKVAQAIAALHRRGLAYSDVAILYRTNAQSRSLEEALRLLSIPYRIYGGLSFYQRKEVKDVLAYFRLTSNHYDEEALTRIINYPARGIGDTTMNKLAAASVMAGVPLWDVVADPAKFGVAVHSGTAARLATFVGLINHFTQMAETETAYDLALSIIKESGIHADIYADTSAENLSRQENLQELADSIKQYEQEMAEAGTGEPALLSDYLSQVSLLTDADTDRDDTPRVTLMTVHAAKGLEYEAVFVAGMEDELFPNANARFFPKEMEEERRLFYVALTRAKSYCYLSYARTRIRYGSFLTCEPSPFISEIDPACLRREDIAFTPRTAATDGHRPSIRTAEPPSRPNPLSTLRTRRLSRVAPTPRPSAGKSLDEAGGLRVGQHIEHERFGRGEVRRLEQAGETIKATVQFDNAGEKALLLKFARYRILD